MNALQRISLSTLTGFSLIMGGWCLLEPVKTSWIFITPGQDSIEVILKWWPHLALTGITKSLVDRLEWSFLENLIGPEFVFLYPVSFVILISSLTALLLLAGKHQKNANAMLISLSTGSAFLAYTLVLRPFILPDSFMPTILLDMVAALLFPVSLFYFGRFFSEYPSQLDYDAAIVALNVSSKSFSSGSPSKLDIFLFEKILRPVSGFIGITPVHPKDKPPVEPFGNTRSLEFYDSRKYLIIIAAVCMAGFLLSDVFAEEIVALHPSIAPLLAAIVMVVPGTVFVLTCINSYARLTSQYKLGGKDDRLKLQWLYLPILFFASIAFVLFWFVGFAGIAMFIINIVFDNILDDSIIRSILFMPVLVLFILPLIQVPVFLIALLLSIFYRGTITPRYLIKNSVVYSLIALILTVLFVLLEGTIASLFSAYIQLPGQASAVVAGAISALFIGRIKGSVDEFVDRRLQRYIPETEVTSSQNRLAAVVFSDLKDFSKLIKQDSERAESLLRHFQNESKTVAELHNGRLIKLIGDSLILEFVDPEKAIEALKEIRNRVLSACSILDLPKPIIQSGVTYGVIEKSSEEEVYGDIVLEAARLEKLAIGDAEAEEIIISETVKNFISSRNDVKIIPLEMHMTETMLNNEAYLLELI